MQAQLLRIKKFLYEKLIHINISSMKFLQDAVSINLTSLIEEKDLTEREMVVIAEDFFLSLGFDPLPETFWERSLYTKPQNEKNNFGI